jgi:chromosome segregation ATPase
MPHLEVQPNGQMNFVSSSKSKPKSGHKHHKDDRDRKIDELQQHLDEEIEEKDRCNADYDKLKEYNRQVLEESKGFQQLAVKWRKDFKEMKDKNEELQELLDRKGDQIKSQEKAIKRKDSEIQQKDNEIRQKDKEIDDLRVDMKSLNVIIKDERNENASLREKATALTDDKRRLNENVFVLKDNQEKLLADNKKLREENAKMVDWVNRERRLALEERVARLQREERERREAERRPPRRRQDDDYLDDPRFSRAMPSRTRQTGWGSDY